MSSSITYKRYLESIPHKYQLLKFFRVPIYVIELSNNQLVATCYYKNGSSKRHQLNADFSNRRMVIADFNTFSKSLAELLMRFPKHFLWGSAIASVNVTELLEDGLTSIEVKVIIEAFFVGSTQAKRKIVHTIVNYQGQVVHLEKFG